MAKERNLFPWIWVAAVTFACLIGVRLQSNSLNSHQYILEVQTSGNSIPIGQNSVLQYNVPISELDQAKVGEIVKGTVPIGDGAQVSFVGKVTGGMSTSGSTGSLMIRVISDKYIAPGTTVSGRVGNRLFAGTVVNSPSTQERLLNLEKRLEAVEQPSKEQLSKIEDNMQKVTSGVSAIEGTTTMKQRITELEKRIFQLQHRGPSLSGSLFKDNAEGFHFHGAIGPNTLMPAVDQMETRVAAIEKQPDPSRILEPIMRRLDTTESRINTITTGGNDGPNRDVATRLERRLVRLERQARVFADDLNPPEDADDAVIAAASPSDLASAVVAPAAEGVAPQPVSVVDKLPKTAA